ncbi:hypothetical protein BGW37DRAFT_510384 [Umbelopsis sp. PMI_123]|nr:hypothetical protein BGW37DRAFT_510384 [Umbelopsis sp. PMI_123]
MPTHTQSSWTIKPTLLRWKPWSYAFQDTVRPELIGLLTLRIPFRNQMFWYLITVVMITVCLIMYTFRYIQMENIQKHRDDWLYTRFPELENVLTDTVKQTSKLHEAIPLNRDIQDPYSCENHHLSYSTLKQLIESELGPDRSSPPIDDTVQSNYMILPQFTPNQTVTLQQGQSYCIRLVIFPPKLNPLVAHTFVPIDGSPWDSIMMTLVRQSDHNTTFPVPLRLWNGHSIIFEANPNNLDSNANDISPHQLVDRKSLHIYEAEVKLQDEGRYSLETRLEYTHAMWNFEYQPVVSYQPELIKTPRGWSLTVVGSQKDHFDLPLCTRGDHPGRWLNIKDFPLDRQQKISPNAVDFKGNFWAPYECQYRYIPYEDFNQCLAKKYPLIHWFGDSNSRRSLKKIMTDGTWCSDSQAIQSNETIRRACHCEDYEEPTWNYTLFDTHARAGRLVKTAFANASVEWGKDSSKNESEIWFYKWDGLTDLNEPSWEELFKEYPPPSDMTGYIPGLKVDETWIERYGKEVEVQAVRRLPPPFPMMRTHHGKKSRRDLAVLRKRWYLTLAPPQLIIINLGNWDVSRMPYNEFQAAVQKMINYVKQRYIPYKTAVLYRTPQYFCCRVDTSERQRKFSTLRMEAYDRYARQMLTKHVGAKVWDVYALGESRSWDDKQAVVDCPSNHAPSDVVSLENQILMNSLCNADDWFADL